MATKPMPDFIRAKIEERKAAKAAREAEEAGVEAEVEAPEEDEGEESEEGESEDEEEAHEAERGPVPLRKNGLAALRKNGSPIAVASSPSPRRRSRSFDPGRSFDDAAKWVMKNKVPVLIGLGVVGLFWLASKGKKTAPRYGYVYGVRGTFTDLAEKIGQQSDPPWAPSGSDLDVRTAQYYLNKIAGAGLREDGILGRQTAAALKRFQRGNGLLETGTIDDETGNALEYFFFATSPLPKLKASAVLSPGSIASLEEQAIFRSDLPLSYAPSYAPVTYSPYPMPLQYDGVTYSPYPMSPPPMSPPPARAGRQVASVPKRSKSTARQPGSKAVAPSYATGGDFRTGIQSSSSMYDARYFDYPDYVEAYWDPIPE
jgi:peptidoglycan hydrolase-like protein with peptidoglycan-binding domain